MKLILLVVVATFVVVGLAFYLFRSLDFAVKILFPARNQFRNRLKLHIRRAFVNRADF